MSRPTSTTELFASARWLHPLPSLDTQDVAALLQAISIRLLNLLERRGVIEDRSELTLLDNGLAEREPRSACSCSTAVWWASRWAIPSAAAPSPSTSIRSHCCAD